MVRGGGGGGRKEGREMRERGVEGGGSVLAKLWPLIVFTPLLQCLSLPGSLMIVASVL